MAHNASKNYSSMRGLNKFINKIKDCPTKEAEKEAVRNELYKFSIVFQKANNVGSYQRKKYVCKLLYIFMMGYKLENFGYREAIKLCSASKFSEKQMGYLAVGVLIDENHEALPLLIETIKTDLQSPTFEVQALAVGAIANIGGRTLAKEFSETIINLLMSNQSSIQLKKKSSLCLLRIFKKYPDIVTPEFLSLKITGLLSIYHLGLLTSVMSLLLGMADMAIDISQCQCFLPRVVEILDQMVFNVGQQGHASYDYCGISNPWLQIKLLRFMQFFPITDATLHATLVKITSKILNQPRDPANDGENHKSARNAILMECYSLVATLDSPAELSKTVELLVNGFTSSTSSPNIVLLSLSKLASICFKNPNAKYIAAQHYATIHALLSSKDAEIKLKAFQLFLSIRTNENTNQIVQDMLKIIASEDPILEFPMIENVASLSESVSQTNPAWYVEVFTRLLSVSGNKVAENMWSSLISNITANPQLQPFAAKLYVQFLSEQLKACEALVVVGAIILRKFGAEIANESGFGFSQQYKVLSSQTEVKSARGLEELQLTLESLKNYPQDDSSVSHNVSSDVQSQFGQSQLLPSVQNPAEDEAFKTLCVTKQGVLLQTEQLQVGIMITPNQSSLGLAVFYGNLSDSPLTDLSIGVINPEDNAIKFDAQAWTPTIEAQQQVPHSITVTALKDFSVTPKLALSFRTASGLLVSSEMLLPIIIPSFCSPLVVGTQEFLGLWGLFPAPPCEQQVTWTTVKGIDRARAMQAAIGLNFHMVDGVDPSPGNFVSATTFHTVNAQTNVLCRLESDENHKMFRVTVRSPVPSISSSVANILKQYIN